MQHRQRTVALAWIIVLAGALSARAQTNAAAGLDDTTVSQRLASLEAEIQQLRQASKFQSASYPSAQSQPLPAPFASSSAPADSVAPADNGPGFAPACGPLVGQDFFNCKCRTGGMVAGAEVIFFKPFYTAGGAPNVDAAASNPFTGFVNYPAMPYNYTGAPRLWFGYVGTNGLGGRLRYFEFNQTATNDVSVVFTAPPGIFTQTGYLSLHTYDLELTQQVNFRYWSLQLFGGVRYAQAIQNSNVSVLGLSSFNSRLSYNGTGLTGGLQGERMLTSSGRLSLFFSGRGSLLYGNERDNTRDLFFLYTEGDRQIGNVFASIWEMSVGPQWKVPLRHGGEFFVRTTVEAQFWQGVGNFAPIGTSPSPGLNHNDNAGGFGLLGFAGSIGVTR